MPLSEHEQRLLEQMEQQLVSDDPRFASTMRGPRTMPAARRRLVIGIGGVVAGLALLVVAVVASIGIWLGAAAFVVMLAGLVYALSSSSARPGPTGVVRADGRTAARGPARPGAARLGATRLGATSSGESRQPTRRPARGTFMHRLEQRWERRRDERWG